jgi:hypothetical protein
MVETGKYVYGSVSALLRNVAVLAPPLAHCSLIRF